MTETLQKEPTLEEEFEKMKKEINKEKAKKEVEKMMKEINVEATKEFERMKKEMNKEAEEKLNKEEEEAEEKLKKEAEEELKKTVDLMLDLEIRLTSINNEILNEMELTNKRKYDKLINEKNKLQSFLFNFKYEKNTLENSKLTLELVRIIKRNNKLYEKKMNQLYWQSLLEDNNINDLKEILEIRDNVEEKIYKDGADLGLCILHNAICSTLQVSKSNMKRIRKYNKKYMSFIINENGLEYKKVPFIQQPNNEEMEKILKRVDKNEKDLAEMRDEFGELKVEVEELGEDVNVLNQEKK
jgi:hypothetical protein